MDIPKPDVLDGFLDDVIHSVGQIRELYRWAEPDAFRRPKHGSVELVSGGGAKPDSADLLASTERYRRLIRHSAREVEDARNRLQGAVSDLNDALMLLEPPPSLDGPDVRFLEHPADSGDVRRAREAQKRRNARARRTGDWSEVTGG